MQAYLEFEKPVADLDGKVRELRNLDDSKGKVNVDEEVARLESKASQALADLYKKLDPWQKMQVARHPDRPHYKDFIKSMIEDYQPLSGDRNFADDHAIQTGLGRFNGQPVALIGHEKGNDTQSRLHHNFGMARPEGYRKAVRVMDLAERYSMPVITLVDTSGAYPGIGAEERGQAEAIARSTEKCLTLKTPMISVVIGEGGSGGAIAIAVANRVFMLEHAIYSVISPEGAASILWRDSTRAKEAASSMKITAQDLQDLGVIDEIIPEPLGGAHRNAEAVIESAKSSISAALDELMAKSPDKLMRERREKFMAIGRNL